MLAKIMDQRRASMAIDPIDLTNMAKNRGLDAKKNQMLDFLKKDKS